MCGQCSELHVRHHFWSVWTADAAFLRGFGPTVSSGLYPIRKCPQSGPRTWGLGGGLDRLNHRPLATSAADRSAIRNTEVARFYLGILIWNCILRMMHQPAGARACEVFPVHPGSVGTPVLPICQS